MSSSRKKPTGSTNGSNQSSYLDNILNDFELEITAPPTSKPTSSPAASINFFHNVPLGKSLKTYQRATDRRELMDSTGPRSDDPEKKKGLVARIRSCFGGKC